MKEIEDLKLYLKSNANTALKGMVVHKAYSSLEMLEAVDLMIRDYDSDHAVKKGAIILDVFGLLQGFFVGVDALYDLAISITKYKYNVNLNLNESLHELKFIRNDIVGHPTNRLYPDGSIGFSVFKEASVRKDSFAYETYYYHKNKLEIKERRVVFKDLIASYQAEKVIILKDLVNYCIANREDNNYVSMIYKLYSKLTRGKDITHQEITAIKEQFILSQRLEINSRHRFLWRIDLIYLLINWQENDLDFRAMLTYILKKQLLKIYQMALAMDNKEAKLPKITLPAILKEFYRFIKNNEKVAYQYLMNLNDSSHPFYQSDLDALIKLKPPQNMIKLLKWLKKQTDVNKAFLIGSTLKEYQKKHTNA